MTTRTLLAVFGHPDDESFGAGGTLAKYAAQDATVALVCATNREVGEISDPSLATPETLGDVRKQEMSCAAEALGIGELVMLGYRDSGMDGTADNKHPRAFARALTDEVVARLVGVIRRLRPQVVVTFDPHGGYGHPDHISAHRHTTAAFDAAGDPARYPQEGQPWQPARLLYAVFPRRRILEMRTGLEANGVDTSQFDRFEEAGFGWPDDQVHYTVDVAANVEAKWEALHCHASQFGATNPFRQLPESAAKELMSREFFAQAQPEPDGSAHLGDLFDGL